MKKVLAILLVVCCVTVAQANLLSNPGFEDGPTGNMSAPIPGWSTWGASGWHHDDAGRVIDTKAVKLWWSDAGYWQDIDVEEGHTYTFGCWMQWSALDPLGVDKKGVLKVEWYDATPTLLGTIVFAEITSADPVDIWIQYSASQTAPVGAVVGRLVLAMETGPGTDTGGSVNYDNASLYEFYNQAYAPDPTDDAVVDLSLDDLFWSNRPSGTPGDTVTFDVYFEDEGIITDPNLFDPNFLSAAIKTGITASTVNLTAEAITLTDEHTYSWRVDSHDPNTSGTAVNTQGLVWLFAISDTAPAVDADVDTVSNLQYTWVDEADADNDANTVTLTLSGSYTDDGKSPITAAFFEEGAHEQAGGTIVTIGTQTWTPGAGTHMSGTVTAPVTITNPVAGQTANGLYRFWLNVTDGAGNSANETTRIVYMTCIEAALADPDDPMYQQWQHGDIDGDCDIDLVDFSILAERWASCMTPKAGCTP